MVERLAGTIAERHREMPEESYTAGLIRSGPERVAQKVGEEAGRGGSRGANGERLAEETADLVYHLLVLLESGASGSRAWRGCCVIGTGKLNLVPSLDEARRLARTYDVVPLYAEFIGDLETPISAVLRFADEDTVFS
jgi:phosphoribosyl-ATP pyrophosphohydrolase